MVTFVTVIHVGICLFLILTILLQAGKGAGMGFLGGASQTVFGGRGATTFLGKMTAVTAFLFMMTSMFLAWHASQQEDKKLKAKAALIAKKEKEKVEKLKKERAKKAEEAKKKAAAAKKAAASKPTSAPASKPVEGAAKPADGTAKPAEGAAKPTDGVTPAAPAK
ncbi:MAG: preprotein translocase subunit SecG [Deltaproteobacteria bacterium]|nr:MAG: preprotein translocase subunit SecG [Deltaproteobacteria bacterium]